MDSRPDCAYHRLNENIRLGSRFWVWGRGGVIFSRDNCIRSWLFGTTAVAAIAGAPGVRADVTISANTTATVRPAAPGDNVTITNSGSISSVPVGISVSGVNTANNILNQGAISAAFAGVTINLAGSAMSFTNQGTITAGIDGFEISSTSLLNGDWTNESGGRVIGASRYGFAVYASTVSGNVENAGTIRGGASGMGLEAGAVIGGDIINEEGGTITGGSHGFESQGGTTVSGGISNYGFIEGESGDGMLIGGNVDGRVLNEGGISGNTTGIRLTSVLDQGIVNRGTIEGETGIDISAGLLVLGGISNFGQVTGTGGTAIVMNNQYTTLTLGTGSSITGMVDGAGGDDTLRLIGSGTEDDQFVNFEGLVMDGGAWTLDGDLTLLDGAETPGDVRLNSGVLYMNGDLTAPGGVFAQGGILAGSGDVIADVMIGNGSGVAPGNSIGVLNITGDIVLGAGSNFYAEVQGTAADLMTVTGNVTIDPDSTVVVVPLGGVDIVDQVIIQAGGSVNANFQKIEPNGTMASTKRVDGNKIVLTAVSPTPATLGSQGSVLDTLAFQNALTGAFDPVNGNGAFFFGPEKQLWGKTIYDTVEREDEAGYAGFDQTTLGFIAGLDRLVTDDLRLGGLVGYTETDIEINFASGDIDIQGLYAGIYGIFDRPKVSLIFGAQIGNHDKDFTRPVSVSGVMTNVDASTDGMSYAAHARGGWKHSLNDSWLSQFSLNSAYIHHSQDEYTDSTDTTFGTLDTDTFRFGPSFDLTGDFKSGDVEYTPRFSVGYLQQWTNGDDYIDVAFSSGTQLSSSLVDKDEGFATVGAGLDTSFTNGITAFVGYAGEYNDKEIRNRLTAGLRVGF